MEQRIYNFTLSLFDDNPSTTSLFLRIIGLLSDASLSAIALCCQFRLAACLPGSCRSGEATGSGPSTSPRWRPIIYLFRRFTVEVFVIRLRFGSGMVDNAIPMIRRRIECIELHWNGACINDVVIRPSRDENGEARADHRANAVENGLARTFLHAKELIELVNFHPDLLLGFQCHDHELTVLSRVKYLAKIIILDRDAFNIFHKTFHSNSSNCRFKHC